MADFDLTQTDAQVQSILNDAQDAQGAGAQTTLNTEYIMLKGTNGRYHKILKDSFTEAVRNVLAGLLVNNDKGTTISQIPAISSGDFGSVTPANLASVLGVPRIVGTLTAGETIPSGADLNNLANLPVYRCKSGSIAATLTNTPTNFSSSMGFVLLNMQPYGAASISTQVLIQKDDIFIRRSTYNTSTHVTTWYEWKQVSMS